MVSAMQTIEGFGQFLEVAEAAGDDEADVAVGQVVAAAGFADDLGDLGAGPGHLEAEGLGRHLEALEVLIETEHAALIEADAFEDAVTIEETMVEDRDLGLGLGVELAVDVDFHGDEKPTLGGQEGFFQPESPFSGGYLAA
ncbi:MAG: hypothetical protein RI910_2612 [Verrucomicrobiota bacterium]